MMCASTFREDRIVLGKCDAGISQGLTAAAFPKSQFSVEFSQTRGRSLADALRERKRAQCPGSMGKARGSDTGKFRRQPFDAAQDGGEPVEPALRRGGEISLCEVVCTLESPLSGLSPVGF